MNRLDDISFPFLKLLHDMHESIRKLTNTVLLNSLTVILAFATAPFNRWSPLLGLWLPLWPGLVGGCPDY
jgi:hypothetical protein